MSGALRAGDAAALGAEVARLKAERDHFCGRFDCKPDDLHARIETCIHERGVYVDRMDAALERCAKLETALRALYEVDEFDARVRGFSIRRAPAMDLAREALTPPAT